MFWSSREWDTIEEDREDLKVDKKYKQNKKSDYCYSLTTTPHLIFFLRI